MLRELAPRLLLIAAPFVIWFIWRGVALRTGRPMGATPWTWLVASVSVFLLATLLFFAWERFQAFRKVLP